MGARLNTLNFWRPSICFTLKRKSELLCFALRLSILQVSHAIHSLLQVLNLPRSELVPANPNLLDAVDDLIKLAYLNHPSVLHNLRFRYSHDMIYVCMPALPAFFLGLAHHIYTIS